MNCVNLKVKFDKTLYCKLLKKSIKWSECQNCKLRAYKINFDADRINSRKSKKRCSTGLKIANKDISSKTRKFVNERDNKTCQLCGMVSVHLHHIKYRSEAPLLIDDPNNLISLCLSCHQLVHSNKKKYQPILQNIIANKKN